MVTELWGTKPPKNELYVDCKFEPVASTLILTIYFKLRLRCKVYLYPILGLPSCLLRGVTTHPHQHNLAIMVLGHLLARSILKYLEISSMVSPVFFMSFCLQLYYPPCKGQWCVILQPLLPNIHPHLVAHPVPTNKAMTTESLRYNCFIRNGGNAIPKHACPEAKAAVLLLDWTCSGLLTYAEEILTGKTHKKRPAYYFQVKTRKC